MRPDAGYYVTAAANALVDRWGNAFTGLTESSQLSFTTAPQDTQPPLLQATMPIDNETHVALDSNIMLSFNELVDLSAGQVVLHKATDGSIVETFTHGVGSQGGVITVAPFSYGFEVNPGQDLQAATRYYLSITGAAITDLAGNAFVGIVDPTEFNFKTAPTATAPHTKEAHPTGNEDMLSLIGVPEVLDTTFL
jgi:hypothetical protein